jgi:hypothetical protein
MNLRSKVKARLFGTAKADDFGYEREIEVERSVDGSLELKVLQNVFGLLQRCAVSHDQTPVIPCSVQLSIQIINPVNYRPVYAPFGRIEADDVVEFKKKDGFLRVVRDRSDGLPLR